MMPPVPILRNQIQLREALVAKHLDKTRALARQNNRTTRITHHDRLLYSSSRLICILYRGQLSRIMDSSLPLTDTYPFTKPFSVQSSTMYLQVESFHVSSSLSFAASHTSKNRLLSVTFTQRQLVKFNFASRWQESRIVKSPVSKDKVRKGHKIMQWLTGEFGSFQV